MHRICTFFLFINNINAPVSNALRFINTHIHFIASIFSSCAMFSASCELATCYPFLQQFFLSVVLMFHCTSLGFLLLLKATTKSPFVMRCPNIKCFEKSVSVFFALYCFCSQNFFDFHCWPETRYSMLAPKHTNKYIVIVFAVSNLSNELWQCSLISNRIPFTSCSTI